MPCLVCGAPSTVRSHILPRAFIHILKGDEQRALVGHRHRDGREFTQSGSWDDSILCETHERDLQLPDDYAVAFCRSFGKTARRVPGERFKVPNPHPDRLTSFVMSVVWRYVVSKYGKAAGVTLGPHEARLRTLLFARQPGQSEPAIVIARCAQILDGQEVLLAIHPHCGRVHGLINWRFHIAGFEFWMALDSRTHFFSQEVLANGQDPIVVCELDAEDIRRAEQYQGIFGRMARRRR